MTASERKTGRGRNPASRRNLRQFRDEQPETEAPETPPQPESVAPDVSVQVVSVDSGNQSLAVQGAAQILENAAPAAASLLARVVSGNVRAPVHVRVAAAETVLGANGLLKQPEQSEDHPAISPLLLDKLAAVLTRRQRTIDATEVEVLPASA